MRLTKGSCEQATLFGVRPLFPRVKLASSFFVFYLTLHLSRNRWSFPINQFAAIRAFLLCSEINLNSVTS